MCSSLQLRRPPPAPTTSTLPATNCVPPALRAASARAQATTTAAYATWALGQTPVHPVVGHLSGQSVYHHACCLAGHKRLLLAWPQLCMHCQHCNGITCLAPALAAGGTTVSECLDDSFLDAGTGTCKTCPGGATRTGTTDFTKCTCPTGFVWQAGDCSEPLASPRPAAGWVQLASPLALLALV